MTLIAQLSVNGVPFLVGDVLLSSDHKTGLQVNLPLAGNINETIANRGLTFEVVGFEQKLNLLGGGRLAVGWCGPVDQAERAMRVLQRVAARDRIETADIAAEIDAIDQTRINELQLVVLLLRSVQGSTINAGQYCLGPPRVATRLGPVFATGSGRNDFLRIVDSGEWDFGNEFQMAHGVLGTLVNEELRTGRTIASRWGGGFEAVTFSREAGCFQKVGDILHTFWKFDANAPQSVECIPMFYKTAYVRDALIIRSARLVKTSPGIFDMTENNLKIVPPLLKNAGEYDLNEVGQIDFSYRAICCHIIIEKPDNKTDLAIYIEQRNPDRKVLFSLDEASGRLTIAGELTDSIIEQAMHGGSP